MWCELSGVIAKCIKCILLLYSGIKDTRRIAQSLFKDYPRSVILSENQRIVYSSGGALWNRGVDWGILERKSKLKTQKISGIYTNLQIKNEKVKHFLSII